MPVRALVDDCPLYDLQPQKPSQPVYAAPAPSASLLADATIEQTLLALLGSPNIASRRPLFEQYDAIVQSRTVRRPEQADAAVLALPADEQGVQRALAVSIDCNGRRVAADPYRGAIESVLECAANLACVGAEPLGTTNNLNFGNPEKPHIAWQLSEAVRGLGEACRALAGSDRGRQRLALQRGRDGPDLPDAGDRHGRSAARRAPRRSPRLRARGRRGRAGRPVRAVARGERAGQAARRRRCRTGCPSSRSRRCARRRRPCARRCARARCRARTTSPRAGWRWRSPSAAWPAGSARRSRSTRTSPRRSVRRTTPRRRCSARARAASSSAARRAALEELATLVRRAQAGNGRRRFAGDRGGRRRRDPRLARGSRARARQARGAVRMTAASL